MKGIIWSLIYSVTPNIDETDVTYFYTGDECEKSYEESTCKEEQERHRGQMNDFCVYKFVSELDEGLLLLGLVGVRVRALHGNVQARKGGEHRVYTLLLEGGILHRGRAEPRLTNTVDGLRTPPLLSGLPAPGDAEGSR